jgi:antirestriction protein ArdC
LPQCVLERRQLGNPVQQGGWQTAIPSASYHRRHDRQFTFKQALALGGHVRKSERGTTIVYADRFIPDDERERAREGGGEPPHGHGVMRAGIN